MRGRWCARPTSILALEVADLWGKLNTVTDPHAELRRFVKPGAKIISISVADLYMKANYQDFQRFISPDISIAGDVEATLPTLVEEVRRARRAAACRSSASAPIGCARCTRT